MSECPWCGLPADELDRFVLESTDGPMEHVTLRCVVGHVFCGPVDWLDAE